MEQSLEGLIEKIKREGIEEAKQTAKNIVDEAQLKAEKIIEEARSKAETMISQGRDEAERFRRNAEESLKQAGRDLVLMVQEKIKLIFENILKREVVQVLNKRFLAELILDVVKKWSPQQELALEVIVSPEEKEELLSYVLDKFKQELPAGIEIKVSKNIRRGFRIGVKGEDVYYDFSEESITESLKLLLNPTIAALLQVSNNG